jgi:hypothetical protein
MTITKTAARAEITRRAENRTRKAKGLRPKAGNPEATRLSGAELRAIAGQAKAAPKAGKSTPKGCPVKRVCAEWADLQVPNKGEHMADWWSEYRHATAWFRALRDAK